MERLVWYDRALLDVWSDPVQGIVRCVGWIWYAVTLYFTFCPIDRFCFPPTWLSHRFLVPCAHHQSTLMSVERNLHLPKRKPASNKKNIAHFILKSGTFYLKIRNEKGFILFILTCELIQVRYNNSGIKSWLKVQRYFLPFKSERRWEKKVTYLWYHTQLLLQMSL